MIEREAARVLLFDRRNRVLLLRGQDPGDLARGTWWFTPGGGLDAGETHLQAAIRELHEETGIDIPVSAAPVHERTVEFAFDGLHYRQHELFFAARVLHDVEVSPLHWTDVEMRALLDHRWWTQEELSTTADVIHPDVLRVGLHHFIHSLGSPHT
jgi:8-oxo-dGTP pyrophosphatase MutT (NUDIX family)